MPNRLNVVLTGTDNPYLADRLPLAGEIELFEIGTSGTIISGVFRIRGEDGRLGAPVQIANPDFAYTHQAVVASARLGRQARSTT